MTNILHPLLTVLTIYCGNLIYKAKISFETYVLIFVLSFFLCFIANSEEYECRFSFQDTVMYMERSILHGRHGDRWFSDAVERTWYTPCFTDKEKAIACLQSAVASSGGIDLRAKAVYACVSILTTYSIGCIEEWNRIQESLQKAHYHYDLADFYAELVVREGQRDAIFTRRDKSLPSIKYIIDNYEEN